VLGHNQSVVLTFLSTRPVEGLLDNHTRYAEKWGYQHVVMESTHVYGERQTMLYKWHSIYHHLVNSSEGTLLLFLDQFAVVYGGQELAAVCRGYDMLVATQDLQSDLPASSVMVFRNTAQIRENVRQVVFRIAQWANHVPGFEDIPEPFIVKDYFPPQLFTNFLSNGFIFAAQAAWKDGTAIEFLFKAAPHPFAIHNSPQWGQVNDRWCTTLDYDFRYVTLLVQEAISLEAGTSHVAKYLTPPAVQQESHELHLNPDAEIAFVSLYTPSIGHYGEIHEDNLSRYCRRHGYGYHLYRDNPAFLPAGITANWAKVHLIARHLREHTFVFWIDADVLAINQQIGMEKTIKNRDFIIGTDHAAWSANTCMFGARNVPTMHAVLDYLGMRIEAIDDKSSVYASGGDQQAILEGLENLGMANSEYIVDAMTLATSPIYAKHDSCMVHFPAQLNNNRAATMEIWNRRAVN